MTLAFSAVLWATPYSQLPSAARRAMEAALRTNTRKVAWKASSASASFLRMRRQTPQTIGPWRRTRASKAASSRRQTKASSSSGSAGTSGGTATRRSVRRTPRKEPVAIMVSVVPPGSPPLYFPNPAVLSMPLLPAGHSARRQVWLTLPKPHLWLQRPLRQRQGGCAPRDWPRREGTFAMPMYGFVIDNRKCIGCHACTVACKSEHQVPLGVDRTWVKYVEKGTFPNSRRLFTVMRCNHCEWAPCVTICPVTSLYRREDGVVDFNSDRCIGCKSCLQACPYDALYIDPETDTAAKCNFCTHRLEIGLAPSCVVVCPEQAIIAGNMDDPTTEIARLLDRFPVQVRKPERSEERRVGKE